MVFGDGTSLFDTRGQPLRSSTDKTYLADVGASPAVTAVLQFLESGSEVKLFTGVQLKPNINGFYKAAWKYSDYHYLPVKVSRVRGRPIIKLEYKERSPEGSEKPWQEYYTRRKIEVSSADEKMRTEEKTRLERRRRYR